MLVLGLLPGTISGVLGVMVGATGRAWLGFGMGILLSATNVVLDLLLIPPHKAMGGALANTIAQLGFAALLLVIVHRLYSLDLPWRRLFQILVAALATTFVIPMLLEFWVPGLPGLLCGVFLGGAAYLGWAWSSGHFRVFHGVEHTSRVQDW
jgi:O-antigen/teichoic acid export membrane protein